MKRTKGLGSGRGGGGKGVGAEGRRKRVDNRDESGERGKGTGERLTAKRGWRFCSEPTGVGSGVSLQRLAVGSAGAGGEGDGGGRARTEQGRKAPRGLKPVSPCFSPIESIKEEKLPG